MLALVRKAIARSPFQLCKAISSTELPQLSGSFHSLDVTNRIRQTTKFCAIGIRESRKIPINLETPMSVTLSLCN